MSWKTLAAVLDETRSMLARPNTIFAWSHWRDQSEAVADIDALRKAIANRKTEDLNRVRLLFAPRGPIQQVSIATGWGVDFLTLSTRLDEAMGAILFSGNGDRPRTSD